MIHIQGVPVILCPWMTETITVSRSWRERLLSWPWRPWQSTRSERIPSDVIYHMDGKMLMHPQLYFMMRDL